MPKIKSSLNNLRLKNLAKARKVRLGLIRLKKKGDIKSKTVKKTFNKGFKEIKRRAKITPNEKKQAKIVKKNIKKLGSNINFKRII